MNRSDIQKQLEEKRESNKRSYMDLLKQGAELEPFAVVMVKLDTFLDMLLTEEQLEQFNLYFEMNLSEVIADAKNEVAKKKSAVSPLGLIIP